MITNYEDNTVTFICAVCEQDTSKDIKDFTSKYDEEWKEYEPLVMACSYCDDVSFAINMNIPEIYDMDILAMEMLAPEDDKLQREHIRNIMWKHRTDLVEIIRHDYETAYAANNETEISALRREIADTQT